MHKALPVVLNRRVRRRQRELEVKIYQLRVVHLLEEGGKLLGLSGTTRLLDATDELNHELVVLLVQSYPLKY